MEFVKAILVNGTPSVTIDPDKTFDDKEFLDSLKEIEDKYVFKTPKERSDFVALLCGAFGYSTENINPLLPPVEIGEILVKENGSMDRQSKTKANLNKEAFYDISLHKDEVEDTDLDSVDDTSKMDMSKLFLQTPKPAEDEDYSEDEGEDGSE